MAMDFFDHQERARRHTSRLVVLFVLAVAATIAASYFVVAGAVVMTGAFTPDEPGLTSPPPTISLWDWRLLVVVAGGTLLIVGLSSAVKLAQLAGGGRVVAEHLGGRLLDASTTDPGERKILNVVEEMSIASGVPMPPVYMMDRESGINAFAAGSSPGSAVIAVTRGSVEALDRDQLQGVMAHEFSHILNGDMRLNLRLIGLLQGILVIGLIGRVVMRMAWFSGATSRRRDNRGGAALIAIGLGLMLVGFAGYFFGTLIKAAVSRQREFLADASAVQFTRHPSGIAGALKRILGWSGGSQVKHPNAAEASHMFFGSGVSSFFATHPPLPQRIRRIQPDWDGTIAAEQDSPAKTDTSTTPRRARPSRQQVMRDVLGAAASASALAPSGVVSRVGSVDQQSISYAAQLLADLPDSLREAAREPYGARAVVYALLLSGDDEVRRAQLGTLEAKADRGGGGVAQLTAQLASDATSLDHRARLPLIDLAIGALRGLSPSQYTLFKSNLVELVKADRKIDLFEWSLGRILLRHLAGEFEKVRTPPVRHQSVASVMRPCTVVLSALARSGQHDEPAIAKAVSLGADRLGVPGLSPLAADQCGLRALDKALDVLATASPKLKRSIIEACAACVWADREVTVAEGELLRAIADSLDIPMPPLLPGQQLAESDSMNATPDPATV